ncbi:hypothetical protein [Candidatus Nitrosocosmicus arcticus]|uniref:hypothetical protein n=1 Tax=Candidatus Nitrosocosmicus arcticus TaxID=2035267 RepID=UPI001C948280|nr:hypothetical protein [Candidatus Nitrosocosmicus arcticus]
MGSVSNLDVFGQMEQTSNNFDKAKSSSDEAISLIDSLKGSSLLDSVVEGMQNFSFAISNQSDNNDDEISQTLDSALNYLGPNNTASNITTVSPDKSNITISDNNNNLTSDDNITNNNNSNNNIENMQSMMILPYPMTISSKDYIPLYSSMPLKILNGNILAKLPCNSTNPLLQIVGTSADNNVFPIQMNLVSNFSKLGSMCMYQSIIPNDLSNLLYSHTITNIYLYNPLDFSLEVPTTTSIFIGIHKLIE